jgi:hypothetical protein
MGGGKKEIFQNGVRNPPVKFKNVLQSRFSFNSAPSICQLNESCLYSQDQTRSDIQKIMTCPPEGRKEDHTFGKQKRELLSFGMSTNKNGMMSEENRFY